MKALMFMWTLSGLDRFMPRIKALKAEGIKFIIAYTENDLNEITYEELSNTVELLIPITFHKYPSHLKWLYSQSHVCRQLQDLEFDLVFSLSGMWFQYYSGYIARRLKKPYVLFLRGNGFEAPKLQDRGILSRLFRNSIYRFNGWNCDLVIPISLDLRELAIKMGINENKIGPVISGGVDTELFKPMNVKPHLFTVGYAGRINKEKGSEFLTELIEANKYIKFKLAGKVQTKFNAPSNADYLGVLPHKVMPDYYNACDLIILTSKIEGFPRVILEAYACGVPVFCTPESFPAECEIYGLVMKRDLAKWKRMFTSARVDLSWLRGRGIAAREYALTFGLKEYAREMKIQFDLVMQSKAKDDHLYRIMAGFNIYD